MAVWWLAIDEKNGYAEYAELRDHHVIAQGWPDLGNMHQDRRLERLRNASVENRISMLRDWLQACYPGETFGANQIANLVKFFCDIEVGDFVVGRQGTNVFGICEVYQHFQYSFDQAYNYAHRFGPVRWHDWADVSPNWRPEHVPVMMPAAAQVGQDAALITEAYRRFLRRGY